MTIFADNLVIVANLAIVAIIAIILTSTNF